MLSIHRFVFFIIFFGTATSPVSFAIESYNDAYEAAQSGNYKKAVSLWTPLAEQGDAAAQYTLGWMFESGQGVPQSDQKAIFWYTKAALQGDVAAQHVLATIYSDGKRVDRDDVKAARWLAKAANQGDAIAQFQLGEYYKKGIGVKQDFQQSLNWFKKAAVQGHTPSQINIGEAYQSGQGVDIDYVQAIKWYKKAASQNNALGQFHLAQMYEYGYGVEQDDKKAMSLYLQSANNQYTPSAYKLAEFYELGKGTDVDFKNAVKWYKKSALRGSSAAQFKLGNLYQDGKGVKKYIRSAIEWYNLAANQGNAQAHYQLALLYEKGVTNTNKSQNIRINYKKALLHYQSASTLNFADAYPRLAYFYEQGMGTNVDLQAAIKLYQKSSQPFAIERYQKLLKRTNCYDTATTTLFSINIACTTRDVMRKQLKEQKIVVINEDNNRWSDNYFTGAVIRGSSKLQLTYTREGDFVSARYTFVGRNNPTLISSVKNKIVAKYGEPNKKSGTESQGPASFEWFLNDGINLIVSRDWPDTTTFILYLSIEKKQILDAQQKLSSSKTFKPDEPEKNELTHTHLF